MAKKKPRHSRRTQPTDRRLRDALDRADALLVRQHWTEARLLLDDLLNTHPQHPEILQRLIQAAIPLGDAHTLQYSCERLIGLRPRDPDLPFVLAVAYLQNGWRALALSMARHALTADPTNKGAAQTREMVARLEPLVHEQVTACGLGGADGLECLTLHDRVRSLLNQGRFAKASEVAAQLVQRRPHFAPAYNNGADACFLDGRLAEAIDWEKRLLAFDPDNVFGLANLARYLCLVSNPEQIRPHAERLKSLKPTIKSLAVKQAEALAWLGDDAGVLAVYEQARELPGAEGPEDDANLHHLAAVAAYRQGREEEAQSYWRAALQTVPDFPLARQNLDDLKRPAGDRNAPWSYPFNYYVPMKLIEGLLAQLATVRGRNDDKAVEREAQRYLKAHPELEGLVRLLLDRGDQAGRELALRLAGTIRTPAMLENVRDFALGQRGSDKLRIEATQLAQQAGLLTAGPQRFWIGGEPRDGKLQRFEVHSDVVERTHAPGVFDLLTQAIHATRAGEPARAERLLRQALAIDPNDPVALNNLAAACAQLGRTKESEALSIRLHELHPDNLFARTALASLAAERGQLDRARQLLEPLLARTRFHIGEMTALGMAQVNLHLAAREYDTARHWLDMLRQVNPTHPLVPSLEARLAGR
jgi:tetratricopeptide (TPR) repeat protein